MFATPRTAGVLVGYLADRALGDPRRGHPVAAFGTAAAALESLTYRESRAAGAVHVGLLIGSLGLLGRRRNGPPGTAAGRARSR
ncbi:cobD/Cbib family protein [Mycobacterium intracellulare 1956]|uniref:CobD/Cbib family protein n=1 Tax=Mycobacterium intracellulare 1956 TaxID=1299331 RepID=X8CSF6_MYCIT|nr:cobD/Cbib family protein [Mycobacterium intracellulare 1956]